MPAAAGRRRTARRRRGAAAGAAAARRRSTGCTPTCTTRTSGSRAGAAGGWLAGRRRTARGSASTTWASRRWAWRSGGAFGRAGSTAASPGIFSDVLGRHTVFGRGAGAGAARRDRLRGCSTSTSSTAGTSAALAQRMPVRLRLLRRSARTPLHGRVAADAATSSARASSTPACRASRSTPSRRCSGWSSAAACAGSPRDYQLYRIPINDFGQQIGQVYQESRSSGYSRATWRRRTAALVYDNALFGYTSPFAGQRYRFQVSPTVGRASSSCRRWRTTGATSACAPSPWRCRALHFGRYGRDSRRDADQQLYPRHVPGLPLVVRGYYGAYSDCREAGQGPAAATARCSSSSSAAAWRWPRRSCASRSIGAAGCSAAAAPADRGLRLLRRRASPGPADANPASSLRPAQPSDDQTTGATRRPSGRSSPAPGVGARINLFGYLILEVDYVNAFAAGTAGTGSSTSSPASDVRCELLAPGPGHRVDVRAS